MGTGTSRRRAAWLAVAAAIAGGCGGTAPSVTHPSTQSASAFAWLRPTRTPASWEIATLPTGASMALPPGWGLIPGDRGTLSAALLGAHKAFLGYLNLTPRQGDETIADWASFRVQHNAEEGDGDVVTLAATTDQPVGNARWSCVQDTYATMAGTRYVELACLVAGPRTSVVVVGASSRKEWPRISAVIARAILSVRA